MNEDLNIIFGEQGEKQLAAAISHLQTTTNQLSASVDRMGKEMAQGSLSMKDMGQQATSTGGALGGFARELGAVATAAAAFATIKESVTAFADFGQGLADLSSITGLTGKDLENMGHVATDMAVEVEGGATAALKAMEAIGSAKPELLESAAALTQVTEAANTLAQASGDALPQAAQNLTGIMNQFGAGAEQADRFINVLAAGSLEGAANITELAESMKQSGAIAAAFDVSIEETTAALEALADKSIKGGEAGTALRNILASMAASEALPKKALDAFERLGVDLDVVSNKALPFQERLEELAKVSGDATALVEIFGKENLTAAQILLNSTKRVEELTEAVTGTNTAYSQAQTRTNTFKEEMKRLGREFGNLAIEVGRAVKPIVSGLIGIAKATKDVIQFFLDNKEAAIILAGSIALLNSSYIASTASILANTIAVQANLLWTKAVSVAQGISIGLQAAYITVTNLLTGSIGAATAAQRLFNLAMTSNPIGAAIVAATALGAALYALSGNSKDLTEAEKRRLEITEGINHAIGEANTQIGKETASLEALVRGINSETASKAEKKALTDQLLGQYGKYLTALDQEKVKAGDVAAAHHKIKDAIIAEITAKQKAAAIEDLFGEQLKVQRDNAFKLSEALARQEKLGRVDKVFSPDQIIKFTEEFKRLPQELQRAADAGRGIALASAKDFGLNELQVETVAFFDDFSKIYNDLNKQAGELGRSADATPFVREFDAITSAATALDEGLAEINSKFGTSFADMLGGVGDVATDTATGLGKTDSEAIAAAGSIDALRKKIEDLQKAMDATPDMGLRNQLGRQIELAGIQLERLQNGPTLDLVKPEAISSIVKMNEELTNSMRTMTDLPVKVDAAKASLTGFGQLVQWFGEDAALSLKAGIDQIKGAFVDFGISAAESIGYAIGAAENVGDAFKAAIRELIPQILKLAGIAMINAAGFPANSAIALPLLIAGVALIGLGGLLKGIQAKKQREREQAGASLPEVGTARPSVQGGFGGFMQQMQDQPIVINLSAQMDGTEMGGVFKTVTVMHGKRSIKG